MDKVAYFTDLKPVGLVLLPYLTYIPNTHTLISETHLLVLYPCRVVQLILYHLNL